MIGEMDRRRMLGVSFSAAAIAGLGLLRAAPSAAASVATPPACVDAPIPVVPGMSGDPRANQCWYELDEVGLYHPSQQFLDAVGAVAQAVGNPDVEVGIAEAWRNDRLAGTYPGGFISIFAPLRQQLKVLSDIEASVFDKYYGCDPRGLVSAMADFGQGVLYDPRRPAGALVHMMDGTPPVGYHAWHAFNRAFAFVGVAPRMWNKFDQLTAFGWAVQSTAKPVADTHNPPLPAAVMRRLARTWLHMRPDEIDQAFMNFPYPPGIA